MGSQRALSNNNARVGSILEVRCVGSLLMEGQDLRQEHRAPATVFSVFAFSQLHLRADCLPQEHLAWAAQTQAWPERPQQVVGTVMVTLVEFIVGVSCNL